MAGGKTDIARPLVGLVVEGRTEYQALHEMLGRLGVRYTHPSCFNGQAVEAPIPALVAKKLLPGVRVQLAKRASKVLVVLDLEGRKTPLRKFRKDLLREMKKQVQQTEGREAARKVMVFVCNRRFENWLIADPRGLLKSKHIESDLSRQVSCHADTKDALSLLKSALRKDSSYRKAVHGPRLARLVRVEDKRVRLCSESLRDFVASVRSL